MDINSLNIKNTAIGERVFNLQTKNFLCLQKPFYESELLLFSIQVKTLKI